MMVNHNETDRIFVYSEIILNKIVVARGGYAYCAFFKTRRVFLIRQFVVFFYLIIFRLPYCYYICD